MNAYASLFHITIGIGTEVYAKFGVDKILPPIDGDVQIAFDQSSTQTGICIANMKGVPLIIMDVINKGLPSAKEYTQMLKRFLRNNLSDYSVKRIICEEVNHNAPQSHVKRILMNLVSMIEDIAYDYRAEFFVINNVVWKKNYLKDPKYKGRKKTTSLVKVAIQEESYSRFPNFQSYFLLGGNKDSCDALGILCGFMEEWFAPNSAKEVQVNSMMPPVPIRKYIKEYKTEEAVMSEIKEYPVFYKGYKVLKYNPAYTLEDNCLRAINYNRAGVLLRTDDLKSIQLWQFDAGEAVTISTILKVRRS